MEETLTIDKVSTLLSGGLGNQLFQLSAAKSILGMDSINLIADIGNPRNNENKLPAICSYDFADLGISVVHRPVHKVPQERIYKFLLILSSHGQKGIWSRLAFNLVKFTTLVLSKFTPVQPIILCDGVGFDPEIRIRHNNSLLVGCFHSFRWLQSGDTFEYMRALRPIESPLWLKELTREANLNRPIIVHVRLGDYLGIPNLGHLGPSYYLAGLKECLIQSPNAPIWILSDDVDKVREYLLDSIWDKARIIETQDSDAVLNLEVLRLGGSFVLSNSTFSWWGAMLAHTENPFVAVPDKWFKESDNPNDIYPPNWKLIGVSS